MRQVLRRPLHESRNAGERGAVAILVAVSMTMLLVVTAMVLDFGLIRLDRQQVKATADTAVMAGLRAGDTGTGQFYTHRAVCGTLRFLKANDSRLSSLPASVCATPDLGAICDPNQPLLNNLAYDQTVTSGGATFRVIIKAPYALSDGGFTEESYDSLTADQSQSDNCDQLGVIIAESRKPGLGSLATQGDLGFSLRSVGRVTITSDSELAPALILLEKTECRVLEVGSAGAGAGSFIKVVGAAGLPGSIHADTDATGSSCGTGTGQQAFYGKQANGIVAYGSGGTPSTSGVITSVASLLNRPANVVSDALAHVYGTSATSGTGSDQNPVTGLKLVSRKPLDERYRTGIRTAISNAAGVWTATPSVWAGGAANVADCSPTAAQQDLSEKLYIDCPGNPGITLNNTTLKAKEIFFNGFVKGGSIAMPNAENVYINNTASNGSPVNSAAISLANNTGFCVRSVSCLPTTNTCTLTPVTGRAVVFVRQGNVDASGGLLRLCNSTMVLLGGQTSDGCVPVSDGTEPKSMPCVGPASGNSRVDLAGGASLDWTAPNAFPGAIPEANRAAAWRDTFEDLALWSESAGLYRMTGGGAINLTGVVAAPNATPFNVGGGGNQTLTDAQFFTRTFSVSGGGTLTMSVDARNAVSIPTVNGFLLVR